jgi:hypothetical protein
MTWAYTPTTRRPSLKNSKMIYASVLSKSELERGINKMISQNHMPIAGKSCFTAAQDRRDKLVKIRIQ